MRSNRRQFLTLAGAVTLHVSQPAHAAKISTLGGRAFGSYWRISCAASADALRLRASIEAIITSVDGAMSPYRADSEITRFNTSTSTDWFTVSNDTQTVVAAALALARRCDGAFDPAVGPWVGRYGFGPITGDLVGHHRQLSARAGAIRKDDPRLSLDLCGIAKGHALDRMVRSLDSAGLGHYLLELGGEVFARGRHPSARPWQVAIEDPRPDATGLVQMVTLDGRAIATSGNKVNGYDVAGQRYGHIINPLTTTCVGTNLLSVSVMAERAIIADGLATGMMAMGPDKAAAFATDAGIDALLLVADGQRLKTVTTGRFADQLLA